MVNKNDRWSALSMKDRAELIKLYVGNGVTSLNDIKKDYNSFGPGGPIETDEYGYPADITPAVIEADYPRESEVWKKADASNADMVQRLKQGSSRVTIQDWEDPKKVATHKMMSAGNYVVGNVQNINGQLFDFTDPKHGFKNPNRAAIDSAIERGDYVEFDTEGDARYFAEHYKKHYNSFGDGGRILDGTEEEQTLSGEPVYYDDTYIEPARMVAASSKTLDFFDDFSNRYQKYHGKDIGEYVKERVKSTDAIVDTNIKQGGFYRPINDKITLQNSIFPEVFTHELTHKINDNPRFWKAPKRTRSEIKTLKDAYVLGNLGMWGPLYKIIKGRDEYFTTNTEIRRAISERYGNVLGEDLNNVILNMSDTELASIAGGFGYATRNDFYKYEDDIKTAEDAYNSTNELSILKIGWDDLSRKDKRYFKKNFKNGNMKNNIGVLDTDRLNLVRHALINIAADGGELNSLGDGGDTLEKVDKIVEKAEPWVSGASLALLGATAVAPEAGVVTLPAMYIANSAGTLMDGYQAVRDFQNGDYTSGVWNSIEALAGAFGGKAATKLARTTGGRAIGKLKEQLVRERFNSSGDSITRLMRKGLTYEQAAEKVMQNAVNYVDNSSKVKDVAKGIRDYYDKMFKNGADIADTIFDVKDIGEGVYSGFKEEHPVEVYKRGGKLKIVT